MSLSSCSQVLALCIQYPGDPAGRGSQGWEREGCKASALSRSSRLLPRDFPSLLARVPEERARFVSLLAPGTFPRKQPAPRPSPPPPRTQPRPSPNQPRTPASAATAALSSHGCLGSARKPGTQEWPLGAREADTLRRIWGAPHAEWSSSRESSRAGDIRLKLPVA